VALNALTSSQPSQDLLLLADELRRNDDCDQLPDRLLRRISKQSLRSCVPRRDDAVQVFRNDGIVRGIHDGGEPRVDIFEASVKDVDGMMSVTIRSSHSSEVVPAMIGQDSR
jgi:hypothetical protein